MPKDVVTGCPTLLPLLGKVCVEVQVGAPADLYALLYRFMEEIYIWKSGERRR